MYCTTLILTSSTAYSDSFTVSKLSVSEFRADVINCNYPRQLVDQKKGSFPNRCVLEELRSYDKPAGAQLKSVKFYSEFKHLQLFE